MEKGDYFFKLLFILFIIGVLLMRLLMKSLIKAKLFGMK